MTHLNNDGTNGFGNQQETEAVFGSPLGLGPGFPGTLGDMRFMGYTVIVVGVLNCLTLVGVVLGIPLIITGRRFLDAVSRFEVFGQTGSQESLAAGFHELGRSFRIMKILVVIYLVLTVLYFLGMFFFGGLAMLAGLADGGGY